MERQRAPDVPVLGSNREQIDAASVPAPLVVTKRTLPDVPLWNPYIMGGRPFLANPQSAVFSPFSVPAYVLACGPPGVMAALKLFVAAFGTFLLGRALGMRLGGALLAGLVFGFSLWSVSWVSWPTMSVWALLPWLCLLAELLPAPPGPLPFAGLAARGRPAVPRRPPGVELPGAGRASVLFWLVRALALADAARARLPLRLLTLRRRRWRSAPRWRRSR